MFANMFFLTNDHLGFFFCHITFFFLVVHRVWWAVPKLLGGGYSPPCKKKFGPNDSAAPIKSHYVLGFVLAPFQFRPLSWIFF